jgi:hypothetical protein
MSRVSDEGEIFLPLPVPRAQVQPAKQFRSTWITVSLKSVRERGDFDRYVALLPKRHREELLAAVPGIWLPMDVVHAHYTACDALGYSDRAILDIGASVGKNAQGTALGTVANVAMSSGVTPWTIMSQFQRFWERLASGGGGVEIRKLGPKEARLELVGWPCAEIRYVRVAMRGVLLGVFSLFCRQAFMHEYPALCTRTTLGYRAQWA